MIRYLILALAVTISLRGSEVANYLAPRQNRDVIFFLSTTKSGSNLITGSLTALTRKPISWFYWGDTILDPKCKHTQDISYNRLSLPLVSDRPLLYRTHYQFDALKKVPTDRNRLIFLTRNPKELLYRKFFLTHSSQEDPNPAFIQEFLDEYLEAFSVFDSWHPDTKMIVFYEDYIQNDIGTLLQLLQFMHEEPLFLDDFLCNKERYTAELLESYAKQHVNNSGGSSSKHGPQAIYYTTTASTETLQSIDVYILNRAPAIWEKYLVRFQEV